MKKLFLLFIFLFVLTSVAMGQVINDFDAAPADTNYWNWLDFVKGGNTEGPGGHYEISYGADPDTGWVKVSYVTDPVFFGTGAMQIDYSVHNAESYGGYSKIAHWHPDSNAVYDFSAYDSISVMYYNSVPQSLAGRVVLRLCLHDVSNSPNGDSTYTNAECEYYYSFLYVLDNAPGWHEIAMPLKADPNFWNGEGFNLTVWAGIAGNGTLDPDKIKGFTFEFSISGAGEGDVGAGTIIFDHLTLVGRKHRDFIFFNGRALPNNFSSWTWGQSTIEVEEGAGATPGTNALKWVQGDEYGDGWTGMGFTIDPVYDMGFEWETDSIKYKLKAEDGVGALRVQLEDGTAKVGTVFTPTADNQWHYYAFKLSEMPYQDGTSNFNPANVVVAGMMAEGTGVAGKVVYITDWWTGNPVIDVVAPAAPTGVSGVTGQYYNLVIWEDVPGEAGEVYNVYASSSPITNLNDPLVDVVALDIQEDTQTAVHWLYYPLIDTDVEYYYAVVCKDAAGNVSTTFGSSTAISNKAQGIATISLNPPADFAADGDFGEWDASGIMPFVITPENGYVPLGTVTDSNDLTATVFLAVDQDYLYVAADVIDDVYNYGEGDWWNQDAFQMFIGLYDQRGPTHTSIKRGAEPDYILYFVEDRLQLDYSGGGELYTPEDENYYFSDLGGVDYVIEAKLPLDLLLAADDARFHPVRGMRIPIDLYFHDNDGTEWEGNLGLSPNSTDHQWQNPTEWTYTWIGDTTYTTTTVEENQNPFVVREYSLSQNFPNPFNPTTAISFSIPKAGRVTIEIFNTLGQKIQTLVDEHKAAGSYTIELKGDKLPTGIYFYRMQAGDYSQIKKMMLIK